MKKRLFAINMLLCFLLVFLSACDKNMQPHLASPHLFEVGTDHATLMAPWKIWPEEASYRASLEHENIEQITYIMNQKWIPIDLTESRLRYLYLGYRTSQEVLINHHSIRIGTSDPNIEKRIQEAKEKFIDYAFNQSYQPVMLFFMNANYDRNLKEVKLSMTALINMEEPFLQNTSLVPLLVLDKMPTGTSSHNYTHKNVAVNSLSLQNGDHEFDGSGYALSDLLHADNIAQGDTFELVFRVHIPENSLEDPQWKAFFIIENHQEKTKYGVYKIAIEE